MMLAFGQSMARRSPSLFTMCQRSYFSRPEAVKPPNPEETYTKVRESVDEFSAVERLLPLDTVPFIPQKSLQNYPTPSGWIPPAPTPPNLPYFIGRTRYHNLPVFLDLVPPEKTKKLTKVTKVQGDIWRFEKDLLNYLRKHTFDGLVASHVSEVNRWVKVKGSFVEEVKEFLLEKGF